MRVVIESPYAADTADGIARNVRCARAAMRDCLLRGDSPYASHLLYTQPGVLNDADPAERKQGIEAGFAWRSAANKTVVYTDLGITNGMEYGIAHATAAGLPVEYRTLPGWPHERSSTLT